MSKLNIWNFLNSRHTTLNNHSVFFIINKLGGLSLKSYTSLNKSISKNYTTLFSILLSALVTITLLVILLLL